MFGPYSMIDPLMYFGLGFLAASLLGLVIMPLVHNRSARLTKRRLEASTPLSLDEARAGRDHMRAEFAVSARRLEIRLEERQDRMADLLAELGRKNSALNRLKLEIVDKSAVIFALAGRGGHSKIGFVAPRTSLPGSPKTFSSTRPSLAGESTSERAGVVGAGPVTRSSSGSVAARSW